MFLLKPKHNCYCAFCKTPRRIYRKKRLSLVNVLASALSSAVIMFALWQKYDPRVMIVFVLCLAFSEVFVQLRWRMSVACRQCGFDPVQYLKDPEGAAQKVKAHLDQRREDPKYLLAKPLHLPALPAEKAKALHEKSKGKLLSRSI